MAILVTGGTGFIGGAVVRELAMLGQPVRALSRKQNPRDPELAALPVEWTTAELLDPTGLRYAMEGCDQVYHLAGRIATHPSDEQMVHEVNVQGTQNVFEAALAMGVRRVVYTGSIFALGIGKTGEPPVNEQTVRYNLDSLTSPYVRSKRAAELLIDTYQQRGLDIVTVYPGFCVGPGDRHISSSRLILAYLKRILPGYPPGGICQIDVRDAAHAHVLAMHQAPTNERYLATGYNVTYQQILEIVAQLVHRRPPTLKLPVAALKAAGHAMEKVSHQPLIDSGMAELLDYTWWYDDTKIRLDLGIQYGSLTDAFRDAIGWFVRAGMVSRQQAGGLGDVMAAEGNVRPSH